MVATRANTWKEMALQPHALQVVRAGANVRRIKQSEAKFQEGRMQLLKRGSTKRQCSVVTYNRYLSISFRTP